MTPAELRTAIETLGLSIEGFARASRCGSRTVRHWLAGTRAIPGPVVTLVKLLLLPVPEPVAWFRERARLPAR